MRSPLKLLFGALFAITAALAHAADSDSQKSTVSGVTVTVTPQNLTRGAKTWAFKVVLDTHSAELPDDFLQSATLLDDSGAVSMPVAWDGAGPGGHHREGILRFKPSDTGAVTLEIKRPGEPEPRKFRWRLQ